MVKRTKYLDKIIPFIDKGLIKAIIGVRRSGKTVLLNQLKDYMISRGIDKEQIVELNFESYSNRHLTKAETFYEYVLARSKAVKGKKLYLFFDEVQEVSDWQKVINSFSVDINCDIYITGSNSNMLSGELVTYISGRYVHFTVYPFTFSEYVEYYKTENGEERNSLITQPRGLEVLFEDYLKYGGLPQRFTLSEDNSIRAYLEDVFSTIVIKDIIARSKITDVELLQRLTAFLLDNVGNPFSGNTICRKLKSEGVNTTVATLLNYISAIKTAMVVQSAKRYDIKGKEIFATNEKYYATDLGLRNTVKSSGIVDYSKLYENVVYIEMLSRGYDVSVGKIGEYEVDFICTKGQEKLYVQVAYLLAEPSTVEREFRPLLLIPDNYPKYVISGDIHDFSQNGIVHLNIIDFLLK